MLNRRKDVFLWGMSRWRAFVMIKFYAETHLIDHLMIAIIIFRFIESKTQTSIGPSVELNLYHFMKCNIWGHRNPVFEERIEFSFLLLFNINYSCTVLSIVQVKLQVAKLGLDRTDIVWSFSRIEFVYHAFEERIEFSFSLLFSIDHCAVNCSSLLVQFCQFGPRQHLAYKWKECRKLYNAWVLEETIILDLNAKSGWLPVAWLEWPFFPLT